MTTYPARIESGARKVLRDHLRENGDSYQQSAQWHATEVPKLGWYFTHDRRQHDAVLVAETGQARYHNTYYRPAEALAFFASELKARTALTTHLIINGRLRVNQDLAFKSNSPIGTWESMRLRGPGWLFNQWFNFDSRLDTEWHIVSDSGRARTVSFAESAVSEKSWNTYLHELLDGIEVGRVPPHGVDMPGRVAPLRKRPPVKVSDIVWTMRDAARGGGMGLERVISIEPLPQSEGWLVRTADTRDHRANHHVLPGDRDTFLPFRAEPDFPVALETAETLRLHARFEPVRDSDGVPLTLI